MTAHYFAPGYIPRQDWQNAVRQDPSPACSARCRSRRRSNRSIHRVSENTTSLTPPPGGLPQALTFRNERALENMTEAEQAAFYEMTGPAGLGPQPGLVTLGTGKPY